MPTTWRQTGSVREWRGLWRSPVVTDRRSCAPEGDYRHCHRQLLCDYLLANGIKVQHILPTGEAQPHKATPGVKIVEGTVTYPGQPTLFDLDEP